MGWTQDREKAIQRYMNEEHMNRKQAEEYVDTMEGALASFEDPWTDFTPYDERIPRLRDDERI